MIGFICNFVLPSKNNTSCERDSIKIVIFMTFETEAIFVFSKKELKGHPSLGYIIKPLFSDAIFSGS